MGVFSALPPPPPTPPPSSTHTHTHTHTHPTLHPSPPPLSLSLSLSLSLGLSRQLHLKRARFVSFAGPRGHSRPGAAGEEGRGSRAYQPRRLRQQWQSTTAKKKLNHGGNQKLGSTDWGSEDCHSNWQTQHCLGKSERENDENEKEGEPQQTNKDRNSKPREDGLRKVALGK